MLYFPALRGIMRYSKFLVPDIPFTEDVMLSVVLGSYTSKSGGKEIAGFSISLIFPFPDKVNLRVSASLVLSDSLSTDALMEKSPTPPVKSLGLLCSGKGFTLIFSSLDFIVFLIF